MPTVPGEIQDTLPEVSESHMLMAMTVESDAREAQRTAQAAENPSSIEDLLRRGRSPEQEIADEVNAARNTPKEQRTQEQQRVIDEYSKWYDRAIKPKLERGPGEPAVKPMEQWQKKGKRYAESKQSLSDAFEEESGAPQRGGESSTRSGDKRSPLFQKELIPENPNLKKYDYTPGELYHVLRQWADPDSARQHLKDIIRKRQKDDDQVREYIPKSDTDEELENFLRRTPMS